VKRDDLFEVAGVRGGKVRTCWGLAQGAAGLVTAGSRSSPQVNIVAHVARALGIPARVHTPTGTPSPEVADAVACGAERVEHKAGYNNVIIARAREDAAARGWREIPFGMQCQDAIDWTKNQVANIPAGVKRIVMPVGSGMSLAGVLHGLRAAGRDIPVLGVVVGADPAKRLDEFAPDGWRSMVTLLNPGVGYDAAVHAEVGGVLLDPIYEAKCARFLEPGDLLWIVGVRATATAPAPAPAAKKPRAPARTIPAGGAPPVWVTGDSLNAAALLPPGDVDLVFSCPPYFDLEKYSTDPKDLSNAGTYEAFLKDYREIIRVAVSRLRANRFACFVVGDLRDSKGFYRNFVSDTIAASSSTATGPWRPSSSGTGPSTSSPITRPRPDGSGRSPSTG